MKYDKETGCLSDVHSIVKDLLPMVNPADIAITGWDISGENLFAACKRACVLEPDLVNQLKPHLSTIAPLKAAFNKDYVAAN